MMSGMSIILYALSISLQVAGALLLIIFSLSTKRRDIIRSFAKSHIIARDGNTKLLSYNHEAFVETYRIAYFSKVSVAFIAVGYLIGVFGDIGTGNRLLAAVSIIALTAVLIAITVLLVNKLVRNVSKITNEELKAAGAEPDMESISKDEVDALFDEEFPID